jgi:hypothetical protein
MDGGGGRCRGGTLMRASGHARGRRAMRAVAALVAATALAGCGHVGRPLYHWDGFQNQLYEHFKGQGAGPDDQLRALDAQAERARAAGAALPPGFRAHRAMVYLRMGRDDEARVQLEAEKASFPESAPYMDFLLKNMKAPRP